MLFEERLGWELYRPLGLSWFQRGFWHIAEPYGNAADTINQYLGVPNRSWGKETEPIQEYGDTELKDSIYHIPLKIASEEYIQKAITFEQFQKIDFDYIIATHPLNEASYSYLAKTYKPGSVFIRHVGDTSSQPKCAHNVMATVKTPFQSDLNVLRYFPEHHSSYCYTPPANHNVLKSFVTHFKGMRDYREILMYEKAMPDFIFKMHGSDERDGVISGSKMPGAIKDSAFVIHLKYTGCGGFLPREALSCGRPVIVKKSYCYEYLTMEGDLYEDSVNAIDLDLGSWQQNIDKIRYFSDPDRHTEMCRNTAEKFKRDVNFEYEAAQIKSWLESLKKE